MGIGREIEEIGWMDGNILVLTLTFRGMRAINFQ